MTPNDYGSLASHARTQKLKSAKIIFWIVGVLTILMAFVAYNQVRDAESILESKSAMQSRMANDPEVARVAGGLDPFFAKMIKQAKLEVGITFGMGMIFILCAMFVYRRPVITTVTGLVLYLASTAFFLYAKMSANEMGSAALSMIIKVAIILALVGAVKTAVSIERQEREGAGY